MIVKKECTVSKKTLEQLEFDKLLRLVKAYCKGPGGIAHLEERHFSTDIETLENDLNVVSDFSELIQTREAPSVNEYEDITKELYYLAKEGYVLDAEAVLKILIILLNYDEFLGDYTKDKRANHPYLFACLNLEEYERRPIELILRVFDNEGNVKPDASPELSKIYKRITSVSRQLDSEFNKILSAYKDQGILSENSESWRSGRRVLVIPAENKRKISGVIHDQSASGKTVFIEPEGVMRINNELFSLENEKKAEIFRILKELSVQLRDYRSLIEEIFKKICLLDALRAKALFSLSIDGVVPQLSPHPGLTLHNLHHPLLHLHLKNTGGQSVPFDLDMHGANRLLLISGPNAGGKSVTLKAVGLAHLMVYYGLLIPVSSDSVVAMFSSIHTDIGDQQSIDEGLSTYSSHLTNLNQIVNKSDKRSLVLLDEIGSGTDPKLGGAIAEGILRALMDRRVFGIVTTHYSALKVFAFKNQGILNGAMLFDKEHLQPTYKLKVGKPGSSYAFEVAKKIGLDENIIKYARKKVGKKENEVEDLLVDLQEGKAILDEQLEYIQNEKKQLEKLMTNYNQLNEELQIKRKKLQIQTKELKIERSNNENLELQNLISKLQKEKDLEKAMQLKEDADRKRSEQAKTIYELKKDVSEARNDDTPIKVGGSVRILDSELTGEVLTINGEKAEVLVGLMKMWVAMVDIIPIKDPLEVKRKGINVKGVAFQNSFSPKLDIRGYKIQDAADTLQEFFDQALLSNARTLEVVHGKGSGALRKLVIKKMKEYKDLDSYWHPAEESGGDGVTMIQM